MEYVTMFISHIFKTAEYWAEYFLIEGFPEITPETLLPSIQAFVYNLADMASLYLAVIFL